MISGIMSRSRCVRRSPCATSALRFSACRGEQGRDRVPTGQKKGPARNLAGPGNRNLSTRTARESLRSEEHTSELQSLRHLVCRLLLEKKKLSRGKVV